MLQCNETAENDKADNGNSLKAQAFTSRLDYLIKSRSQAKRMTLSPQEAQAILDRWNTRNRRITQSKVRQYASVMQKGEWHYTGEPIIFSSLRLLDGQHRLMACVESGMPLDVLLVFGAPDTAFAYIDIGKARTAGDIFSIHGVENANQMAAATNFVVHYETNSVGNNNTFEHADLYDQFLLHPKLPESGWVGYAFARNRLASPSMMLAIHYLCARKAREEADAFFGKVGEGLGFSGKKDPAYRLHKRLMDNIISQEKLGRRQLAALVIKAWNAHRLGREVGTLKYSPDEKFPKVI